MYAATATPYPDSLADAQWKLLRPYLPRRRADRRGRPPAHGLRPILDAILYVNRTGCSWRHLPHDLPPWQTVYRHFRKWQRDGTWERMHRLLRRRCRLAAGKLTEPGVLIADSQSARTTEKRGACCGYDAGKKVKGHKRHVAVDTLGLVWAVLVLPADVQDRDAARPLLEPAGVGRTRVKVVFADGGYAGELVDWLKKALGWVLEIVRRPVGTKGFAVPPKRRIVERTFARLDRCRRHSKDYEELPEVSVAMIQVTMIGIMARRMAWIPYLKHALRGRD